MNQPFKIASRLRSFTYALKGVRTMIATQHNAWIHALATCVACAAGAYWRITRDEWCWIVLAIVSVWTAEALSTAFEFLADATTPAFHPLVGKAKDVAAGAVLFCAIGSVVIGALVFGPHVMEAWK